MHNLLLSTGYPSFDNVTGGLLEGAINTLLCTDQYSKTTFIAQVLSKLLLKGKVASYIDLDTAFAGYLRTGFLNVEGVKNLVLYVPTGKDIEKVIAQICSVRISSLALVVFDSVSMFYHLFSEDPDFGDLNRKMGAYLSLFQSMASRINTSILITSMMRAKKFVKAGVTSWLPSPSGGRVLEKRSRQIISLVGDAEKLRIQVVKHPDPKIVGRVFVEAIE